MAFNKAADGSRRRPMRRRKKVCVFCGKDNVIDYKDLNKTDSFSKLKAIKPFDIKRKLNAKRIEGASIKEAGSLVYNYGAMPVDDETITVLQALADEPEEILYIPNESGGLMPGTGGIGTYLFIGGGALLMILSAYFLMRKKKK